jgi:adenylate cyclase
VAGKVVAGLKLHLSPDEKEKISDRGTENTDAFELNLQAASYLNLNTRQGHLHAIRLYEQALALDPRYVAAYTGLANSSMELYRNYSREESLLAIAENAIEEALRLKPDFANAHSIKGHLLMHLNKPEEAISEAKKAILLAPGNSWGHFHLGFIYMETGHPREAAEAFEETLRIKPDDLTSHYNLALQYHILNNIERRLTASLNAIVYYEKHVRRHPDDQGKRTFYSILLFFAGMHDESKREMEAILALPGLDGSTCYNIACTYLFMLDNSRALELFEKAVDLGYARKDVFLNDPDLEPLRGTEAWKRIMGKLSEP